MSAALRGQCLTVIVRYPNPPCQSEHAKFAHFYIKSCLSAAAQGKTWPFKRMIETSDDQSQSYGYPTVLRGSDGNIHLSYSYRGPEGATILYNSFAIDWIKE